MIFSLFKTKTVSAQDWANLNRFEKENTELAAPLENENRIVFMGNSITEAWATYDSLFFKENPYINRGISGQTTPQMLLRFKADVIDLKPKVVVLLAGTNDLAENTGPTSFEAIMNNIISMVQLAKVNNIKVILASVLPAYDYPWKTGLNPNKKIPELNKRIKKYADENTIIYLDYFSAMVDDKNGLIDDYTRDGVHPNKKGYDIMKPLVQDAITKTLKN
jgi:lysophospholipase L1-like esterase